MLNKDISGRESGQLSRDILIGAIIGGIAGICIGYLFKAGFIYTSWLSAMLWVLTIDPIITGTILGIALGAVIGSIVSSYFAKDNTHENVIYDTNGSETIQLREEQLKITKRKIQTGKVNIHREVLTKEKNITVPVTREELVIEKTVLNSDTQDDTGAHTETIRIPVKEEQIDISKHPVILEDVSIKKHEFEDTKHITETLKKEIPHTNTIGDVKVINKKSTKR